MPCVDCCGQECDIAWFSRYGGWQSYKFKGVKTFEYRLGDVSTFKDFSRILKTSSIKDVYYGTICTSGNISRTEADYLDSLRYSIQAYLYNSVTGEWDIPIDLDKKSWVKYSSRDKLFDVAVRFIHAEEIIIQSQ